VNTSMGVGSFLLGAAKFLAVPYLSFLLLIFVSQRMILFQAPGAVADPRALGGELITLVAAEPLISGGHAAARGGAPDAAADAPPRVAALYYLPASPARPTLVFWHGNADQLGWGPAYVGRALRDRFGLGFFAIEYPGCAAACPAAGLSVPRRAYLYQGGPTIGARHARGPRGAGC
jgi:hypothetical protein